MPTPIYLVKVGMTMTEGMVAEWYVPDGGHVGKGEPLYVLETEKVNMDVEAESDGVVKHAVEIGVMLEPGDIVGYIYTPGEEIPQDPASKPAAPAGAVTARAVPNAAPKPQTAAGGDGRIKASPAAKRIATELGVDYTALQGSGPGGRIVEADVRAAGESAPKASPLARRLASERGVDLGKVKGTGPGGRIVQTDIEAAATAPRGAAQEPAAGEQIALRGMRKTIAQRMHHSLQTSAQLTMDMEAVMDDAVKLRNSLVEEWQDEGVRPTYTDLVIMAAAKALRKHPFMNSRFNETEIVLLDEIHVGMAVALADGLVVPVIRNVDQLGMKELAKESSRLAVAAREGSLGPDDFAGGTFTVTALGMFGVDSFTPIINEPQSGILGVNRLYDGIEWEGDRPVRTKKMNLSLTWDHRAVDGAPAAQFLAEVCSLLSSPFRLLV